MKFKTVPGIVLTSICDEYYLVSATKNIHVSETVAFFWKQFEKGTSLDELLFLAKEEYEISDLENLRSDIERIVLEMKETHILEEY